MRNGVHIQFSHHARSMVVDRLWADRKTFRNLRIGASLGNKVQDLSFSKRQRLPISAVFKGCHDGFRKIAAAFKKQGKARLHFFGWTAFQKQPIDTCGDPIGKLANSSKTSHHSNLGFWRPSSRFPKNLHSPRQGHAAIEGHQCRTKRFGQRNRLQPIFRFAYDGYIIDPIQDLSQSVSYQPMVICNDRGFDRGGSS